MLKYQHAEFKIKITHRILYQKEINQSKMKIGWGSEYRQVRLHGPDVLDGARLGEERVEDSNSFRPVPGAAELGELDSLGDS